jgi:hypothetical protein
VAGHETSSSVALGSVAAPTGAVTSAAWVNALFDERENIAWLSLVLST